MPLLWRRNMYFAIKWRNNIMTETEKLAKKYADANYRKYERNELWDDVRTDHVPIKKAYRNGAQYMLERVCKYLESEHPTWYEHFGEELKKAMEE
jgi:hypothetical protein